MTRTILAYLDPGSTSQIVSILLGGVASAAVAIKLFWRRILVFLRIKKPLEDLPEDTAGEPAVARAQATEQHAEPVESKS